MSMLKKMQNMQYNGCYNYNFTQIRQGVKIVKAAVKVSKHVKIKKPSDPISHMWEMLLHSTWGAVSHICVCVLCCLFRLLMQRQTLSSPVNKAPPYESTSVREWCKCKRENTSTRRLKCRNCHVRLCFGINPLMRGWRWLLDEQRNVINLSF